ncbi:MAG: (Fe-S)-binding protein [Mycobacteriales bacterium]
MAREPATPAFDAFHPPQRGDLDDCVHCGFCLPSCPTYTLWGQEMDSPRGRIYLMAAGLAGEPLSDSMVRHFDACLGCMACVSACPSGVRYDQLIGATRAQVERRHRRPWRQRWLRAAVFAVFPYPRRLRVLAGPLRAYQRSGAQRLARRSGLVDRLPAPLASMERLAPSLVRAPRLPERVRAIGPRRAVVGLVTGCVQSVFFPGVNAATARVLAAEGMDVAIPPGQGCCGALSAHAGREEEALRFARRQIELWEAAGVEEVVVNSAGCGSVLKDYGHLLRDDPAYAERARELAVKVRDLTEVLSELPPVAPRHPLPLRVAYHDACHLAHAQGIRAQPRALLSAIPGLELLEIPEAELCCGSAGVYNLLAPAAAEELGQRKAASVAATGAELLVTANPGCAMQISRWLAEFGAAPPTAHVAEVLDASLRGLPALDLRVGGSSAT